MLVKGTSLVVMTVALSCRWRTCVRGFPHSTMTGVDTGEREVSAAMVTSSLTVPMAAMKARILAVRYANIHVHTLE